MTKKPMMLVQTVKKMVVVAAMVMMNLVEKRSVPQTSSKNLGCEQVRPIPIIDA